MYVWGVFSEPINNFSQFLFSEARGIIRLWENGVRDSASLQSVCRAFRGYQRTSHTLALEHLVVYNPAQSGCHFEDGSAGAPPGGASIHQAQVCSAFASVTGGPDTTMWSHKTNSGICQISEISSYFVSLLLISIQGLSFSASHICHLGSRREL